MGRPLVIAGTTVQGKPFSTEQWRGKVVLVDFWATWCPPCREELPEVIKLYQEYHPKGLEIVGVSCDSDRRALQEFAKQNPEMRWPQLFGPRPPSGWHALAQQFGVQSVPTMYLIDRNGVLRSVEARNRVEELVKALLAEEAKPVPAKAAAGPATRPAAPPAKPASRPAAPARPAGGARAR